MTAVCVLEPSRASAIPGGGFGAELLLSVFSAAIARAQVLRGELGSGLCLHPNLRFF